MRKVKLTTAILTICIGGLMALSCVAMFCLLSIFSDVFNEIEELKAELNSLKLFIAGILIFSVGMVVIGSIFCRRQQDKGLCIAILVLNSILFLVELIGLFSIFDSDIPDGSEIGIMGILDLLAVGVAVAFSIVYLVMLSKVNPAVSKDIYTQSLGITENTVTENVSLKAHGASQTAQVLSSQQQALENIRQGINAESSRVPQAKPEFVSGITKGYKIATAVCAIAIGLIAIVVWYIYINRLDSIRISMQVVHARNIMFVLLLLAVASVVMGTLLFDSKRQKTLTLGLIISFGASLICAIVGLIWNSSKYFDYFRYRVGAFEVFLLVLMALAVGLFSFYYFILQRKAKPAEQNDLISTNKRWAKLTSAVLTIVVGAILFISMIVAIDSLNLTEKALWDDHDTVPYYNVFDDLGTVGAFRVVYFLMLGISALLILIGSLSCRNKRDKSLSASMLISVCVAVVLEIILLAIAISHSRNNGSFAIYISYGDVIFLALSTLIVIFSIIYITSLNSADNRGVIYNRGFVPVQEQKQVSTGALDQGAVIQSLNKVNIKDVIRERIELLKRLKVDGILTDAEFKKAVMKELEKL